MGELTKLLCREGADCHEVESALPRFWRSPLLPRLASLLGTYRCCSSCAGENGLFFPFSCNTLDYALAAVMALRLNLYVQWHIIPQFCPMSCVRTK